MRTYNSFLTTNNSSQIVEIFRSYKNDPSSVDSIWNKFFQSLEPDEIQILNEE